MRKRMIKIVQYLSLVIICCGLGACAGAGGKQQKEKVVKQQPGFTLPEIPMMLTSPDDRAKFLATHYWDNFDFKDTVYIHLPDVTEQALVDFMDMMNHVPASVADSAITHALKGASAEPKMLNYFWETFSRYWYDPNSPLRNEDFYIMVCRVVGGLPQADEAMNSRAKYNLTQALKNRPGTVAADFTYTLESGKQGTLYSIHSPYTILFFYNPDCHMCAEIKKYLRESSVLNELLKKKQTALLAFYPDEDVDLWREHSNEMLPMWINAYDKGVVVDREQTYDLRAIPTFYLLDKDKKVLLKDVQIEEIEAYLKNKLL